MAKILIVDDEGSIRNTLKDILEFEKYEVHEASDGLECLVKLKKDNYDVIVMDIKMPKMDGMEALERVQLLAADTPVIMISGHASIDTAVEAVKKGAFDFIQKPFPPEVVQLKVKRALELAAEKRANNRLRAENEYLRDPDSTAQIDPKKAERGNIIGDSDVMLEVHRRIAKVAASETTVFIHGESGTGKELVAQRIHELSTRSAKPFVKVNCGALADNLLESELFGHEKGAFTGAIKQRMGRFELADGGTILLDEVGDVSPAMQVKLLRVLQEQAFERVGGEKTISVDVRVVSATHRDLKQMVDAGQFREDLYYRLHVLPINVPALRERTADISSLALHFLTRVKANTPRGDRRIDAAAMATLTQYRWPGNVRELENAIEQSLILADDGVVSDADLPAHIGGGSPQVSTHKFLSELAGLPLTDALERVERALIERAYEQANGVKTETARRLGIKASGLYYKLDKFGIDRSEADDSE